MWPQKWKASAFWARSASSTKPPPARPTSSRPVRARKPRRELAAATLSLSMHPRRAEQALELEERVERPLREHLAVGCEDDRVGAAGNGERLPDVGVCLLVEEAQLDLRVVREQAQRRLERGAERAVGRGEGRNGQRRARLEMLDQADAAAELRPLVVERERRLR